MRKEHVTFAACGLAALAAGLVPMLSALGIIPAPERSFNAPRWVVFVAGSLFFLGGVMILVQAVVKDAMSFASFVGATMLTGLMVIGNWIAFGPGNRECEASISIPGFGVSDRLADLPCRLGFGYGALLLDLFVLMGLSKWLADKVVPSSGLARGAHKLFLWGIGALLLPLIAIAFILGSINDRIVALRGKRTMKDRDGTRLPH